jgi:hypothetical protein
LTLQLLIHGSDGLIKKILSLDLNPVFQFHDFGILFSHALSSCFDLFESLLVEDELLVLHLLFVEHELAFVGFAGHHQLVDFAVVDAVDGSLGLEDLAEVEVPFDVLQDLPDFVWARFQTDGFVDHIEWRVHRLGEVVQRLDLRLQVTDLGLLVVDCSVLKSQTRQLPDPVSSSRTTP